MALFTKDTVKAAPKAAGDETVPTQLIPYPTGNPPDPMEVYDEAHPERSQDWSTTAPEPPARKGK